VKVDLDGLAANIKAELRGERAQEVACMVDQLVKHVKKLEVLATVVTFADAFRGEIGCGEVFLETSGSDWHLVWRAPSPPKGRRPGVWIWRQTVSARQMAIDDWDAEMSGRVMASEVRGQWGGELDTPPADQPAKEGRGEPA